MTSEDDGWEEKYIATVSELDDFKKTTTEIERELQTIVDGQNSTIEKLNTKTASQTKEINHLSSENASLIASNERATEKLDRLTSELDEAKRDLEQYRNTAERLERLRREDEFKVTKLEEQRTKAEEDAIIAESQREVLVEQLKVKEAENSHLRIELSEASQVKRPAHMTPRAAVDGAAAGAAVVPKEEFQSFLKELKKVADMCHVHNRQRN